MFENETWHDVSGHKIMVSNHRQSIHHIKETKPFHHDMFGNYVVMSLISRSWAFATCLQLPQRYSAPNQFSLWMAACCYKLWKAEKDAFMCTNLWPWHYAFLLHTNDEIRLSATTATTICPNIHQHGYDQDHMLRAHTVVTTYHWQQGTVVECQIATFQSLSLLNLSEWVAPTQRLKLEYEMLHLGSWPMSMICRLFTYSYSNFYMYHQRVCRLFVVQYNGQIHVLFVTLIDRSSQCRSEMLWPDAIKHSINYMYMYYTHSVHQHSSAHRNSEIEIKSSCVFGKCFWSLMLSGVIN